MTTVRAMSPAALRPRKPRMLIEVRREEVLDAALRLLNRGGYQVVTMEAVLREADLAKPRVHAAYPGVEPLLLALVERERGRAIAALTEAMPGFDDGADFDDILVEAATSLLQSVAANPESWRLLLLPADGAPDDARENFADARAPAFWLANPRHSLLSVSGGSPEVCST
jgi:AcrR family transcriptional regulator